MQSPTPRNLPWIDRLAVSIPGYGGYHEREKRRAAERALRDAIAHRLRSAGAGLDAAIRQLVDRNAAEEVAAEATSASPERPAHHLLTEVGAVERVRRNLDRVAERIRSSGSGTDHFYAADHVDLVNADSLHAFDLRLFEQAEALVRRFEEPDRDHDFLADAESDLRTIEQRLDERALTMQGIR